MLNPKLIAFPLCHHLMQRFMKNYDVAKTRLHLWITLSDLFMCHSGLKRKLSFNRLSWLGLDLFLEKASLCDKEKGGLKIWECPFFSWTADASCSYVLCRSAADSYPHSSHHVTPLSAFRGLCCPGWVLLFRRKVSGGVEDAASYGGCRYHSQKHCSFPAVLPRSSGETQLPQRSHLCVVGFLHALPGCL